MVDPRPCLLCEREFLPRDARHVYCSSSCSAKAKYRRDRVRLAALENRQYQHKPSHVQQRGQRTPSNVDCVSYSMCLSNAAARGMASVPCEGCGQYEAEAKVVVIARRHTELDVGIHGCGYGNRRMGRR